MIAGTLLLGAASVYDICIGDGDVPDPMFVSRGNRESVMIFFNTSAHIRRDSTDEEWWDSLENTLVVLDKVAPHVAEWVREQHKAGRIIFEREETGTYARYDYFDDLLIINYHTMTEVDGRKASVLAHEWRHSKQNFGKWFKSIVAAMILGEKKEEILENDAYLYESKTLLAFFP